MIQNLKTRFQFDSKLALSNCPLSQDCAQGTSVLLSKIDPSGSPIATITPRGLNKELSLPPHCKLSYFNHLK